MKNPICGTFVRHKQSGFICLEIATKFYFDSIDNKIIPRCSNHPLINFKESSLEEYLSQELLES